MKATFVRHRQSTGNAGMPCNDLALLSLTELGWQQARNAAANWIETPDLIVTSPYLRTQQTAAPTIERFLMSRPRAINYFFDDLKRLQDKLEDGCEIYGGPLSLVTPPSDQPIEFEPISFRGMSSRGSSGTGGTPEELFFPLPYNDEQVTIVRRLKRAAGVTVQGPPGTGKTHTIANVCLQSSRIQTAPSTRIKFFLCGFLEPPKELNRHWLISM